jgi:hypothetical protein
MQNQGNTRLNYYKCYSKTLGLIVNGGFKIIIRMNCVTLITDDRPSLLLFALFSGLALHMKVSS